MLLCDSQQSSWSFNIKVRPYSWEDKSKLMHFTDDVWLYQRLSCYILANEITSAAWILTTLQCLAGHLETQRSEFSPQSISSHYRAGSETWTRAWNLDCKNLLINSRFHRQQRQLSNKDKSPIMRWKTKSRRYMRCWKGEDGCCTQHKSMQKSLLRVTLTVRKLSLGQSSFLCWLCFSQLW